MPPSPLALAAHSENIERPRRQVFLKIFLVVAAGILLNAMWQCGSTLWKGHRLSNVAVQHFHEQLNTERYEEICSDADSILGEQNQAELLRILRAVHKGLGNVGGTTLTEIHVESKPQGTLTIATYKTAFEKGSGIETFVFRNNKGTLKLYGYHVDSNKLIVN